MKWNRCSLGIETSIELIDTQGSKKAKSRLGGIIINVAAPLLSCDLYRGTKKERI